MENGEKDGLRRCPRSKITLRHNTQLGERCYQQTESKTDCSTKSTDEATFYMFGFYLLPWFSHLKKGKHTRYFHFLTFHCAKIHITLKVTTLSVQFGRDKSIHTVLQQLS